MYTSPSRETDIRKAVFLYFWGGKIQRKETEIQSGKF